MNGFVGFGVGAGSGFGVLDRAFSSGTAVDCLTEVLRPRGSGAAVDDDAAACFGPPDLDRAFGSSGTAGGG